ncbi:hypothetical protein ACFQJD_03260 [Haloplanus sp. GCM10025708]|uniref:hypothetical protein n=1 Tax=Haloplanus sp. GCM10025708 TaxID=3252679 RepID=UPI0036135222
MNRTVIVALALAVAGTVALPSVAAPLAVGDRVTENVHLTPSDGPNGDYASLADGELVVDLSATNPNVEGRASTPTRSRPSTTSSASATAGPAPPASGSLTDRTPSRSARAATKSSPRRPASPSARTTRSPWTSSSTPPGRRRTGGSTTSRFTRVPEEVTIDADGGDDGPAVRRFAPNADSRHVTLSNAPAGRPVSLGLGRLELDSSGGGNLTLDGLNVTTTTGSAGVTVRVGGPTATTGRAVPGGDLLGAVTVEARGGTRGWQARFGVSQSYLDATGVTPESLAVYRSTGDEWRRLDANVTKRSDRLAVRANASNASTLAVVAADRDVDDVREPRAENPDQTDDRPAGSERQSSRAAVRANPPLIGGERRIRVGTGRYRCRISRSSSSLESSQSSRP